MPIANFEDLFTSQYCTIMILSSPGPHLLYHCWIGRSNTLTLANACVCSGMGKEDTPVALPAAKDSTTEPEVWRRADPEKGESAGAFRKMTREEALEYLGIDSSPPKSVVDWQEQVSLPNATLADVSFHSYPNNNMPPEVATDYVAMLGAMPTVENDGVVKDRGGRELFRYPTVGKIVETARACMAAHKFSVLFPGGYRWDRKTNTVTISMSFRHASGFTIDAGEFPMPVEGNNSKAVCCAVSEARKYALGLGLNMSWLDVTEDAIQRRERGVNGNGQVPPPQQQPPQTTQRTVVGQEAQKPAVPPPPCHSNRVDQYKELAADGRVSLGRLKVRGANALRCYTIVTGRPPPVDGKFPNPPAPALLRGITDLDMHVNSTYEEKEFPPDFDHQAYIELANRGCEPNEEVLFWKNGTRTAIGIDLDELFMKPAAKPTEEPTDIPF